MSKQHFFTLFIVLCIGAVVVVAQDQPLYQETYRPQFHYTAPCNWLNDPNGLVYHDGEYHLFYQYHPDGLVWGPMHWGHAVSTDLLHWETLPIALYPDENGTIFSGSVVIDERNTAGFGENAMVAIYSYSTQTQGIAYSTDNGRTWTKYEGNPVMDALAPDFRDPKVFWHDATEQWIMAIAAGREVQFFASPNLINWEFLSGFTTSGLAGTLEVPDLLPMEIDGETKWVLIVSVNDGAPAEGSGTMYFIGSFDGERFSSDNPGEIFWLDYGADNYAGTTFHNAPDGGHWFVAWMSNWRYATNTPTNPWRSAMTLPRELKLVRTEAGLRLQQILIDLDSIRGDTLLTLENQSVEDTLVLDARGRTLELNVTFEAGNASAFGIELHRGDVDKLAIFYDALSQRLFIQRPASNIPNFPTQYSAPLSPDEDGFIHLQIVLDESSVEVFAAHGTIVMTSQVYISPHYDGIALFSHEGTTTVTSLEIQSLHSVWEGTTAVCNQ